jgi:3-oxocholest-4-en-26-oate---CoA ligase
VPHLTILDVGGSSESGAQMGQTSTGPRNATGRFVPNPGAVVVSEDMTRILSPGDDEIGWLAQQGLIPLGYLGDSEKTADVPGYRGDSALRARGSGSLGRRQRHRSAGA